VTDALQNEKAIEIEERMYLYRWHQMRCFLRIHASVLRRRQA